MKIAFFVSSIGDSDLAVKTIQALEKVGQYETLLISLTKPAQQRVAAFRSSSLALNSTLVDILHVDGDQFPQGVCTPQQLATIEKYLADLQLDYAYFGVPSVNNEIPFQLAEILNIPVLIAYEFMFKPENHTLWKYVPSLAKNPLVKWALPLVAALEDFPVAKSSVYITGHLSIDNAFSQGSVSSKTPNEIRDSLQILADDSLMFASSTTQPVEVDSAFLDCLLAELKKHPKIQLRLGLHPGIQHFDVYLQTIVTLCQKHSDVSAQFKIILPETMLDKVKSPELTINHAVHKNLFLRVNITGDEAASAADRVTQAVPGALLNQAVLKGVPTYSSLGKPYLPRIYSANTLATFFTTNRQAPLQKKVLELNEKSAPENYAEILLGKR